MLLPLVASATAVEIDGVYYNLITKSGVAEVVKKPKGYYADSIVIPEKFVYDEVEYKVTAIGDRAFFECNELLAVELPQSINSIGSAAFMYCNGLDSIAIPESVTVIESNVFGACVNLRRVVLPDKITRIGNSAFNSCYMLDSLNLPNTVETIEDWAFTGCKSLTYIDIPQSLRKVGRSVFANCSSITSVRIPDLSSWCKIVFADLNANPLYHTHKLIVNDEEITDLVIPEGITAIGQAAFAYCSNLNSVTIPTTVTSIGNNAFNDCSNMTSAIIPNSVTSIGNYAFWRCSALSSVKIPNSVTSIGEHAFENCSGLTSITIPDKVSRITSNTFMGCSSLTSITIGSGVIYIGSQAFASCKELSDVYCLAKNVPMTEPDAFKESFIEYATLHVPASAISSYKSSSPWSTFKSFIAISDGEEKKCATPNISYVNDKLTFYCKTEGVEYAYEIKNEDVKKGFSGKVELTKTYNITVYATRDGYIDSDVATATLCWIDAEPGPGDITTQVAEVRATPVLITSEGGVLTLKGVPLGAKVSVYDLSGAQVGSAISQNSLAMVNTNMQSGTVAIVKIGEKSVKIMIK
jgi:hypothetical protein